jgi:ATP-dependent helicase/nuclease subunit B
MAATVYLICGPSGSGKTTRLVERCRERAWEPGSVLWLAPTLRSAAQITALLAGEDGPLTPLVLTIQDLADELVAVNIPQARPLSRVQRRLLLDEVVTDLHDQGRLKHFARVVETRGFAEGMLVLLEELRRQEVSPEDFSRVAGRRTPQGGEELAREKDRNCADVYERFQQRLAACGLLDPESRLASARDLLSRASARPFRQVRALFLDDFVDLSMTQIDLVAALAQSCDEVWITLPDEPDEERAELFAVSRLSLQRLQRLSPQIEYRPRPGRGWGVGSGWQPGPRLYLPGPERGDAEYGGKPQGSRPAGLAHLEMALFRPLRSARPADDATGLLCIQAPGILGETRLVARHIKSLLRDGVPAEQILVTMRDILPYADLAREVFGEYGIPVDVEGALPLTRNPAVSLLLKALRLPEDDWPFAGVTALLRSSYFRPQWHEARFDPDAPQLAEVLLRLLGEPRGREAYLEAVRRWAERVQPGLEDEDAQESRRRRTHELARKCAPFLSRFFRAWERMPSSAPLAEHIAWVRSFAIELGINQAVALRPGMTSDEARDAACWQRFMEEVEHWRARQALGTSHGDTLGGRRRNLDRKTFLRRLTALAAESGLARTPRGPGRVRVLSAPLARHLDADHLFVMGLGERSFPRLATPAPLFDESERQAFRQSGLELPGVADMLPGEMLLFYQVVTRARRQLTLSYPAVDNRGQDLLPSSFLSAVLDCFAPESVPIERRNMLIEGYDRDEPLSPAEHRVRTACLSGREAREGTFLGAGMPPDLAGNLAAAAAVARLRFHAPDYTPYDGMFSDPNVVAELRRLFGPERVFSPTALEDYVACPFRFFMGHVLRLEPLEEPREEIEVTRRGQAVHRALARLHSRLRQAGVHQPSDGIDIEVLERFREAVAEDIERAPGPASKTLWTLEGERLLRVAARYRGQWQDFVKPWVSLKVSPEPYYFEVDFGMPPPEPSEGEPPGPVHGPLVIQVNGLEVRISGRIDRVDVADLGEGVGFWIIDYKTGRAENYTSRALAGFEKLQLTLYALAVEEVLLSGRKARPLGLAYWLVADTGPKVVLPGRSQAQWFKESERWRLVREQLETWITTLVNNIREGVYPLKPRSEHCTNTCPFGQVCRITQSRHIEKDWSLPLPVLAEPKKESDGGTDP